ncbi:CpsD/CapB family tyrosine-protein kinase [Pseudalkalibacillus decolorationis]|uniref:CpsD/CapB family tyrosine-protein kinase n=1 Tax=Pseudalkalibacillus decolorationis TaxID=163879 RepID=UPI0021498559|nr:CpsD/CapB family tyrosine-protein kinase [Pseudalkalibacillus decolorationis]
MRRKQNNKAVRDFKERSLITHYNSKSPISEQYRTIRSNIQFSSVDNEYRTIMVTSSGPGEGKSTTAANLAVTFAQQGKRVLFIDADLRKPTAHYTFRVSNAQGLTNVLTKQIPLGEAHRTTEIEGLHILPSGPVPPNPAELLGSRMMKEITKEASEEFDVILFDTPPLLAVTDGQILANLCDGVVLVVGSQKTENEAALKSKELLEAAKAKLLGVVLNRKKMKEGNYYYYYGS